MTLDGLKVVRWGRNDNYTGTRAAIINAGLLKDGMFPGDPGRGKIMATYMPDGTPARKGSTERRALQVRRKGRGLFEVSVVLEPEEKARRDSERDAQRQREQEQKELLALPHTPAAFLRHGADKFLDLVMAAREVFLMNEARCGFKLDEDTLEEFEELVGCAYWAIRNGGTEGQSPRVKLQRLRFAEARRDPGLQALLERMRGEG